jgi:hypothetical protein
VQDIESVIDDVNAALAIGGRLGLSEARQSGRVNATEFPVEITRLHIQVRQRGHGGRIFVGPVQSRSRQKLHTPVVDARSHSIAVELYLMQPLRP